MQQPSGTARSITPSGDSGGVQQSPSGLHNCQVNVELQSPAKLVDRLHFDFAFRPRTTRQQERGGRGAGRGRFGTAVWRVAAHPIPSITWQLLCEHWLCCRRVRWRVSMPHHRSRGQSPGSCFLGMGVGSRRAQQAQPPAAVATLLPVGSTTATAAPTPASTQDTASCSCSSGATMTVWSLARLCWLRKQ
jgi:hypothetical protein